MYTRQFVLYTGNSIYICPIKLQRASKYVTSLGLILKKFNKLEPISINFVRSISRIFSINHNYIFLLIFLCTYLTLHYLTVA